MGNEDIILMTFQRGRLFVLLSNFTPCGDSGACHTSTSTDYVAASAAATANTSQRSFSGWPICPRT